MQITHNFWLCLVVVTFIQFWQKQDGPANPCHCLYGFNFDSGELKWSMLQVWDIHQITWLCWDCCWEANSIEVIYGLLCMCTKYKFRILPPEYLFFLIFIGFCLSQKRFCCVLLYWKEKIITISQRNYQIIVQFITGTGTASFKKNIYSLLFCKIFLSYFLN